MISFSSIPQAIRVPLFYAEVDPTQANTLQGINERTLLIGQLTASGTALPNVPILATGGLDGSSPPQVPEAVGLFGAGSMLALMAAKYRQNDSFGEVWYLPLADDGGGVAAVGGFEFTHVATANGTLALNIGDYLLSVGVTPTMTLPNLATALTAAINAVTNLPVTAAVDIVSPNPNKVIITAKNKGLAENDIPLVVNYGGTPAGQQTPAGLTYTITAMATGATNPSLTAGLAALADMPFDFVVIPYFDTTSLDAIKTFLNDQTGRWAWNRKIYGHGFTAMKGTVSAATTLGLARNDQHMTILAENGSATPHWLWSPAYTGATAAALKADPGRPMQTLVVNGVAAPPAASQFILTERNTLLFSGISTFNVGADGTVRLENLITTYQKNAFNQPDDSYLEIETMFQIMFMLRDLEAFVTSKYPRMKLADSLARVPPGAQVVTPTMVKQDLIGHYAQLVANFQAQDLETFAAGIIVERDTNNHDRLNVLYDPTIMNQLRIFAVLFQFRQ